MIYIPIWNFSDHPLIIQANAGSPSIVDGKLTYPETPEYFFNCGGALINEGVSIIGGCCGTTHEHIYQIKNAIKTLTN